MRGACYEVVKLMGGRSAKSADISLAVVVFSAISRSRCSGSILLCWQLMEIVLLYVDLNAGRWKVWSLVQSGMWMRMGDELNFDIKV